MTTELERQQQLRSTAKLARSADFEKKLGVAAYHEPRSTAAADAMIGGLTRACIPAFDAANAAHQQKYAHVFGRDALGGAWSAGQVGEDFATVMAATTTGNLRERMTAIYNASLSTFKNDVVNEIDSELSAALRGLDANKLARRQKRTRLPWPMNKVYKDVYRDPANPIDRKHLSTWEHLGDTRVKRPDGEQQSRRTAGDLEAAGIGLSDRERAFMGNPADDERLRWREGGTVFKPNVENKWVKKVQEKLHMPVTAGPSGTALRLFQAWEFLSKPAVASHFRLALLGWMMTSNDHSFHEIMQTSSEYGLPYVPGLEAYHHVDPLTEDDLRGVAGPQGFPDEANYIADHMVSGQVSSSLVTEAQLAQFQRVVNSPIWEAGHAPQAGQLAHAMAVLVYTDEGGQPDHISTYKFINNVLKSGGVTTSFALYHHLRHDPALKAAYDANRFSVRELVEEAKLHADFMQKGLQLLRPYRGMVYRGEGTSKLGKVGESWTQSKFLSTSKQRGTAHGFAQRASGKYRVLVEMQSVTGRDVGTLSIFGAGEGEVIFPHHTTFAIGNAPTEQPDGTHEVSWIDHG